MALDQASLAAVAIFVATYIVVAVGKVPIYHIDRAGAALLGGSLMVGLGVLTPREAYGAIDFDTITLLLGMMIIVANLRVAGFFVLVNHWLAARVRHPAQLLAAVVLASGLLSAFLVNDTICLVMTPLVVELADRLRRNPVPYLLAIAMSSNIGSVATITGNPQNMIIGSLSGISYARFTEVLAPVAVAGLLVVFVFLVLAFKGEFLGARRLEHAPMRVRVHRYLVAKTCLVLGVLIVVFFLGTPPSEAAIIAGGFLLLSRRIKPEKIYREIDWPMLVMFVGLFIVVAGLEKAVLTPDLAGAVRRLHLGTTAVLSAVAAVLSNIVSNVPAVLVLRPFIESLQDPQRAWLILAMASTLAGNFALVGSVANLIVAQRARAKGVELGFWTYLKVGAPLTLVTITFGALWIGLTGG